MTKHTLIEAWRDGDDIHFTNAPVTRDTYEFFHPEYQVAKGLFAEINLNDKTHPVAIPTTLAKKFDIQPGGKISGIYRPYAEDRPPQNRATVSDDLDDAHHVIYTPANAL